MSNLKKALKKHTEQVNTRLAKANINTLDQILHTNLLSKEEKISHIRHKFTCYEKHMKEFYRDSYGIHLRNSLNEFLFDLVDGKHTIDELKEFNKKIKLNLEVANDNFIEEQKLKLETPEIETAKKQTVKNESIEEVVTETVEYICPPKFSNLTKEEEYALSKMPARTLHSKMSKEKIKQKCIDWINTLKTQWMTNYIEAEEKHKLSINRFLIKLYLENRDSNIYPSDFSDLRYLFWREVHDIAKEWLLEKFNDTQAYSDFVNKTLQYWIETEGCIQDDTLLEKIKKLKVENERTNILDIVYEKE